MSGENQHGQPLSICDIGGHALPFELTRWAPPSSAWAQRGCTHSRKLQLMTRHRGRVGGVMSVAPGPYLCAQVYVGYKWHSIPNILMIYKLALCPLNMEEKATWPLALELKGRTTQLILFYEPSY